jgi:MATE family multidrug resistance protein
MAGAVTALFTVMAIHGVFVATGEYLTAFIGQYQGAGRPRRIGVVVWQGFYFSLGAGALVAALVPFVPALFGLAGHAPALLAAEIEYASVLMLGAWPVVLMATLSTFFAGRGQTRVILLVNVLATLVNVVLDWWWIFDHGGRRGYGVAGAAWATVVAQVVGASCYVALILRARYRREFGTLSGWRLDPALMLRLLRFGLPTGLQFSLEVLAFAIFLMLVGRIGAQQLSATAIAFNLNGLVFVPMLGLGVAVSAVVARHLGAERPDLAERSVWSALGISFVYMGACGLLYLGLPRLLLAPYAAGADPGAFAPVEELAIVLLRFVAFYSIFDMANLITAAGLKGAGDTTYPMTLTIGLSVVALLGPTWIACEVLGLGVFAAWWAATAYVLALGILMLRRFRAGRWKSLRLIEAPRRLAEDLAEAPERA